MAQFNVETRVVDKDDFVRLEVDTSFLCFIFDGED